MPPFQFVDSATRSQRRISLLSRPHGWLAESRVLHRDVHLHASELVGVPAIQPLEFIFEWELDAVHGAIVGVIHLRRNAANRRAAVTDLAHQQSRLLVEVQRDEQSSWPVALNYLHLFAVDVIGITDAQIRESVLNLPREGQFGIKMETIEFGT